jgi:hypothetical protein
LRRYRRIHRRGDAKDLNNIPFFWSKNSNVERAFNVKNSPLSPEAKLFSRDATKSFGPEGEYGIISMRGLRNFNDTDEISPYENLVSEEDNLLII